MTVIPFDPTHPRSRRQRTPAEELELARARLAMLERTLLLTLRENARNWARAESAEAELCRLRGIVPGRADDPAPAGR